MSRDNIFSGISGAFWSLTFALIGLTIIVASVGGYGLTRIYLAVMAAYSILGVCYGAWAAQNAVKRAAIKRR